MLMNNHEQLRVNLDTIGHYGNSDKESTIVILNAQIECPSSADPKDLSINIYNANDNSLMASEKVTDVNLKGDVNPVVNLHCSIPSKQCVTNAKMIITKNEEPVKTMTIVFLPKPTHVEINVSEENLTEDAAGSRINKINEKIKNNNQLEELNEKVALLPDKNNQVDKLVEKVALLSAKNNQRDEEMALLSAKVSTLEKKVERCHCRPNFPLDGDELLEQDKVAVVNTEDR